MSGPSPARPHAVLITGCSAGGIGFALAREFHARGLHVFATARDPAKMAALADLGPRMTLLALDVCSPASVEAAAAAVRKHRSGGGGGDGDDGGSGGTGQSLDYLVNNAGALYVTPVLDGDAAKARATFDVNLWGVMAVTQAFSDMVIAARGCIVNVSSVAPVVCSPYYGYYAASKAALQALSETLRREMKPLGVRVITLMAGAVESKVFANGQPYRLPAGSPYGPAEKEIAARAAGSDVAKFKSDPDQFARNVVADILGGNQGIVCRGQHSSIVKFLAAWLPAWLFDLISVLGSGLDKVGKPKQL